MDLGRSSDGEQNVLLVPVLPGTELNWPSEDAPRAFSPFWVILGGVCAALIASVVIWDLLAARGSSKPAAPTPTTRPTPVTPVRQAPPPPARPSPEQVALTAAQRLAARLPVAIDSTALLRRGGSVYVVGGSEHGTPTDAILRIDLATGKITNEGHFIEPLSDAQVARRAGALYLAGGWTGEKRATAVLRWTPGISAPVLVARLPTSLRGGTAAFVGGLLYVAGGSPRQVFAVDVDAGRVVTADSEPPRLRHAESNLGFLAQTLRK